MKIIEKLEKLGKLNDLTKKSWKKLEKLVKLRVFGKDNIYNQHVHFFIRVPYQTKLQRATALPQSLKDKLQVTRESVLFQPRLAGLGPASAVAIAAATGLEDIAAPDAMASSISVTSFPL